MTTFEELQPKKALAVAAHPDDLEFGIGGSVAKWAQDGCEVHYLVCTDGSKGSSNRQADPAELIKIRRQEQRDAADILGVKKVHFLDYEDGMLEATRDLKRDITRLIRQIKPEVVYTMDPTFYYYIDHGFINHNDHRKTGEAVMDSVYPLARDHLSLPELEAEGHKPHKVKTLLLNNFNRSNYTVDITDSFPRKIEALAAHKSQIGDMEQVSKFLRQGAVDAAEGYDFELGESFVRLDQPE